MDKPYVPGRVSLLVPCYNNARFLSYLLESLKAQSYEDWEMLICNDCSPDDTKHVAARMIEENPGRRILYFETPVNGGPAVARNVCIRHSTGEFMVQMDPDDMLTPDSLELRVGAIQNQGKESWTCGWLYIVKGNCSYKHAMKFMREQVLGIDEHDPFERCLSCMPKAGSPSVMAHRNLFIRYGMYDEHPDLYSKTDRELWARWMGFGAKPTHVKQSVTFYRKHPGSIQINYSKDQIDRANLIRIANVRQRLEDGVDEMNSTLWRPSDAEEVLATNTAIRGLEDQIRLICSVRLDRLLSHIPSHIRPTTRILKKRKAPAPPLDPGIQLNEEITRPVARPSSLIRLLLQPYQSGNNGKLKFFRNLAAALPRHGVEVTTDREDFDIAMAGKIETDRPCIVRIDGMYYTSNYIDTRVERNENIFRHIKEADAVVFQSEFSRKMCQGIANEMSVDLGLEEKLVTMIYNGAPVRIPRVRTKVLGFPSILSASRLWLPEKRLKMLIRAFKQVRRKFPKARLYLAGDLPEGLRTNSAIVTCGEIDDGQDLLDLMASVDVYAHTVYQDACPNVVVEALSVGTPVVCSQEGGQAEIVKNGVNGIVAQCDEGPNHCYVQWREPPTDVKEYAKALVEAVSRVPWRVAPVVTDIQQVAANYARFVKQVLERYYA